MEKYVSAVYGHLNNNKTVSLNHKESYISFGFAFALFSFNFYFMITNHNIRLSVFAVYAGSVESIN